MDEKQALLEAAAPANAAYREATKSLKATNFEAVEACRVGVIDAWVKLGVSAEHAAEAMPVLWSLDSSGAVHWLLQKSGALDQLKLKQLEK